MKLSSSEYKVDIIKSQRNKKSEYAFLTLSSHCQQHFLPTVVVNVLFEEEFAFGQC